VGLTLSKQLITEKPSKDEYGITALAQRSDDRLARQTALVQLL